MRFVVVTGMSGAGKSQAVNALEDIGYYCVDNMPPKLLVHFFSCAKARKASSPAKLPLWWIPAAGGCLRICSAGWSS